MTTIAPVRRRWSWASIKNAGFVQRLPVWVWRLLMHTVSRSERTRFNADPITAVDYRFDIDFVGDGIRAHRLDVISPLPGAVVGTPTEPGTPLPVYVYFHGGGWTSGDKAALTKYCASQAVGGMVVVNVNYRRATRFTMAHMLHDANAALAWVSANIAAYGGDPERIVLGGDSAGGQLSALLSAAHFRPELAEHYGIAPAAPREHLRGLVQHCSVVDFSVMFERGFILGLGFIRMLLPGPLRSTRSRGELRRAADYLSPIEWLDSSFPPVFVTTSERDYFYTANLNFIERLREHQVQVDALIYDRDNANTLHTWQQNYRYPESQEVYQRLQHFVHDVTGPMTIAATAAAPTAR
ncbi:alpha/beta hydrolase [Herbiconiux ginsengi]|uniref:Acetyl esterase/lipase n=1 Tax=Herbiconiux ginsengi TaxID=381665 RepID=A0A1H3MBG1_9MICO|nr:alpha/beta hydrolase [Herbiconiux ginsengi]SDY74031.1 Acetyl esterase/lipase [Herbiconiux ginsengi]